MAHARMAYRGGVMPAILNGLGWLAAALAVAALLALWGRRRSRSAAIADPARPRAAIRGSTPLVVRRNPQTVEGLEIQYGPHGLVRGARVGAMNSEHKELLLTMDAIRWHGLSTANKQEVVAVARSTWAEKMCGAGPDIAYITVETSQGEIVGRADPSSLRVI